MTRNPFFSEEDRCSHRAQENSLKRDANLDDVERKEAREIFVFKLVSFRSHEELVEHRRRHN